MLEYIPLVIRSAIETRAFMLPGFSSEMDGFALGDMHVTKLECADLHMLEKSQFLDDLEADLAFSKHSPYFCVFVSEWGGEDLSGVAREFRTNDRRMQALLLCIALRLLKEGDVANPLDFITYSREGAWNVSDPGRYGRGGYGWKTDYHLGRAELATLAGVYQALRAFDSVRQNLQVAVARRLFFDSYDNSLREERDRVLLLLAAVEALSQEPYPDLTRARWSSDDVIRLLDGYEHLRDSIAHTDVLVGKAELIALRSVVRGLVREAIALELEHPRAGRATGSSLISSVTQLDTISAERLANVRVTWDVWGRG